MSDNNLYIETRIADEKPVLAIRANALAKGGDAEIFFQFLEYYKNNAGSLRTTLTVETELCVEKYELPTEYQQLDSENFDIKKVPDIYKKHYLNFLLFFVPDQKQSKKSESNS